MDCLRVRAGRLAVAATVLVAAVSATSGAMLSLAPDALAALPACTDTYTSSGSGGDWSTAANWSTGAVPTSSDVACWGAGQTLTVTTSATAESIQGGALTISGGGLTLASTTHPSSLRGGFALTGGNFSAPAGQTVTLAGAFEFSGGQLNAAVVQTGAHRPRSGGRGRRI